MPAAKTKPETISAQLPPAVVNRCHRVAIALQVLEHELTCYCESSESYDVVPRRAFFDAIENMFIETASDSHVPWPGTTARFLTDILSLTEALQSESNEWRQSVSAKVIRRCVSVCEHRKSLENPQPDGLPKVVDLEPLSELIDQKVPFASIAKIYSWRTPAGEPDLAMVRKAIAGEVTPPATVTYPAKVERCPPLAAIDALLETFAEVERVTLEQQADEETLAAAVATETETVE